MQYNRTKRSVNSMWLEFYSIERSLFELFNDPKTNGIDVLHHIPGYEPHYKTSFNKRGKAVLWPPKNIRMICYANNDALSTIKELTMAMEDIYEKAVEAGGDRFNRMPQRHPKFIENAQLIRTAIYPAHVSVKIKPGDEPFTLLKRTSTLLKNESDEHVEKLMNHYITCFKEHRIDAFIDEKSQALKVNGNDMLKQAQSDHIQLRIASGSSYKLFITNEMGEIMRYPFGFMILNTRPPITQINQIKTTKRIEEIATLLPYHFLDKSIKFWNKGNYEKKPQN